MTSPKPAMWNNDVYDYYDRKPFLNVTNSMANDEISGEMLIIGKGTNYVKVL